MEINIDSILADRKEIEKITLDLFDYIDEIKNKLNKQQINFPEAFLFSIQEYFTSSNFNEYKSIFEKYKNLDSVVIIGIGGSNLILSSIYYFLKPHLKKEVFFVDDCDNLTIKESLVFIEDKYLNNQKTGIILISKSGKTLETLISFQIIKNKIKELDKDWKSKILVVTEENSPLAEISKIEGYDLINLSKEISGRFAIFSQANIFILKIIDVDTDKLIKGALEILQGGFLKDIDSNRILLISSAIYSHFLKNNFIYNIFISSPFIKYFGYWYRQLIAESLGKDKKGLVPLVSFFNKDLHSMYQLFASGPGYILTNFIFLKDSVFNQTINNIDFESIKTLEGKKLQEINTIIYASVRESYLKLNLPFYEIVLEKLNEEEIGKIIQFKMIEVIFLARLLKINPFSQEAVEYYKSEIRKNLKI